MRRFGHIEKMNSEEFVKKVCVVSEIEGPSRRNRPLGRILLCQGCGRLLEMEGSRDSPPSTGVVLRSPLPSLREGVACKGTLGNVLVLVQII